MNLPNRSDDFSRAYPAIGPVVADNTRVRRPAEDVAGMLIPPLFVRSEPHTAPAVPADDSPSFEATTEAGWGSPVADFQPGSDDLVRGDVETEVEDGWEAPLENLPAPADSSQPLLEGTEAELEGAGEAESSDWSLAVPTEWDAEGRLGGDDAFGPPAAAPAGFDVWGGETPITDEVVSDPPLGFSPFEASFAEGWEATEVSGPADLLEEDGGDDSAPLLVGSAEDDGWSWDANAREQEAPQTDAGTGPDTADHADHAESEPPYVASLETDVFGSDTVELESEIAATAFTADQSHSSEWNWQDEREGGEPGEPGEIEQPEPEAGYRDAAAYTAEAHEPWTAGSPDGDSSEAPAEQSEGSVAWTPADVGNSAEGVDAVSAEDAFERAADLSPPLVEDTEGGVDFGGPDSAGAGEMEVHDQEGWSEEWFSAAVAGADDLTGSYASAEDDRSDSYEAAGDSFAPGSDQPTFPDSPDENARDLADRLDRIAAALRTGGAAGPLTQAGGDPLAALIAGYLLGMNDARGPESGGR